MVKFQVIPVTPYQQNCSLLWCEKTMEAVIVDPGGDLDRIKQAVQQLGVKLVKIINTHAHLDHVGGVAALAEDLSLPIEGPHLEDDFWIQSLPNQAQMMGFPEANTFVPNRWLQQGDEIQFGEETLEVRHCPGHTPGHVIFFHRASKLAVVGDVLFQGSIGRTDFPRGDFDTLVKSIREQLWTLGDDVSFIPGHGPMSTFGQERKTNPFVSDKNFG
ncbi:MBL fold metallo-hydrolase [uncultured Pseudoteredinibacter sp.]|uniref:MBL fold metallo-hydrolase n=1 Tax=uncultured Pseudoteredinibacter sp. TaxID=1641701 RepID=UPI0026084170|nr:MBL fold metallo-hydrolase [uncultured Pseudoteredinibacter sp.]